VKKSILSVQVPVRRSSKNGRPTKRTEAVLKPLFKAIRIGVPYKLACMAAGISYDCFNHWRKQDPEFDSQVEQAAAESAVKLFNTIRQQAPETWQSGAWALERRYPEMFAKPEAQLNIVATAQAAAINGTPHNVQTIVVRDLEFLGLKKHPAYQYRPGFAREEQQIIPAELDGTLVREGNIVVTSESRAQTTAERRAKIRARSRELLEAVGTNTGNGDTAAPVARELDSAPAAPEPKPAVSESTPRFSVGWWRGFVFGTETDSFPKAEAIECVRAVLAELGIGIDEKAINFASDPVTGAELKKALSRLTRGELGWKTLTKLYQQEFSRGRTRQECS